MPELTMPCFISIRGTTLAITYRVLSNRTYPLPYHLHALACHICFKRGTILASTHHTYQTGPNLTEPYRATFFFKGELSLPCAGPSHPDKPGRCLACRNHFFIEASGFLEELSLTCPTHPRLAPSIHDLTQLT